MFRIVLFVNFFNGSCATIGSGNGERRVIVPNNVKSLFICPVNMFTGLMKPFLHVLFCQCWFMNTQVRIRLYPFPTVDSSLSTLCNSNLRQSYATNEPSFIVIVRCVCALSLILWILHVFLVSKGDSVFFILSIVLYIVDIGISTISCFFKIIYTHILSFFACLIRAIFFFYVNTYLSDMDA